MSSWTRSVRAPPLTGISRSPSLRQCGVHRLLAKYDYPPDLEEKAIELVLKQAAVFATGVADEDSSRS
jgi:hypothetical protein